MKILKELLESLKIDVPVSVGVVGPHLMAVSSQQLGLAANLHRSEGADSVFSKGEKGTFVGRSSRELASWLLQNEWQKAGIGMAALNSSLEIDYNRLQAINAKRIIADRATGKNLMVVGHFPFVETMGPHVRNLWVMEKQPGTGDISEEEGYQLMSEADVVAITGSSLVNHTFERIMFSCRAASFKIMLGPSTPLSPILFDYGLDVIGGALVEDESTVLSMVEKGIPFRQIKGIRTVVMVKDSLAI